MDSDASSGFFSSMVGGIIPAAGIGARFGGAVPKQYLKLSDTTILDLSISACLPFVDHLVVAIHERDECWGKSLFAEHQQVSVVVGGANRAESVANGLHQLQLKIGISRFENVLIHDAARPLVSESDIRITCEALTSEVQGAVLALPSTDTLKMSKDRGVLGKESIYIEKTLSREHIWQAMTPQIFKAQSLIAAYRDIPLSQITDDAMLMESVGHKIKLVKAMHPNFKITNPADYELAKGWVAMKEASAE